MLIPMELPDLELLDHFFHNAQSNESLMNGYACFTSDSFSGVGAFCFCDDINAWKDLYPAILFIDALIYKDFSAYDDEDLEKLKAIYFKYQDVVWDEADFHSFRCDFTDVMRSYDLNFLERTSLLFELDTEDEFIERLHNTFNDDPKENEEAFLKFLDGYTT